MNWNNKEEVLEEVKEFGFSLEFASEELKNDKDVVITAISNYGGALRFASEELRNDKEVVLAAVNEDGEALKWASEELKKDKEVVLVAVNENGNALEFASEELQNDKEVVLVAVKEIGLALYYASDELRNDKEVVLVAVENDGWALRFASEELKNDKEVVLAAVVMNARNYLAKKVHNYIKDVDYYDYQDNLDFCETEEDKIKEIEKELLTLKGTKNIIDYLQELEEDSEECMDENKDILTLVEKHSYALQFVSEEIISPPKSKTVDVPSQTSIKENAHRAVEKANANKSTPQRNKDKDISR